jgi:hypothetical protein
MKGPDLAREEETKAALMFGALVEWSYEDRGNGEMV